MRLQAQKSGSGAQAFDFLSDSKKSMAGEIDNGFTTAQMQVLEDTAQVCDYKLPISDKCGVYLLPRPMYLRFVNVIDSWWINAMRR